MSFLAQVTSGVSTAGIRMVLAAQEKMGKTTLCSGTPNPLLIPLEIGYAGINCPKTGMISSLKDFHTLLGEIWNAVATGTIPANFPEPIRLWLSRPVKTLAIDSFTALERLIHEDVISRDSAAGRKTVTMESAHGGYGKAYLLANDEMSKILAMFDAMSVTFGINIVATCHVFSSKIVDPTAGEYDCWDLLLHSPKNSKTYGKREIVTQWADAVGFIYDPMYVSTSANGKMAKATSLNKGRVIGFHRTPAYVAGNRFGLTEEISLPVPPENGWNHIANALYSKSGIDVFTR